MKSMRRSARCAAAALCLLVLDACAERPNVVVVTFDTTRADRFEADGGDPALAPNVNRLAKTATVFDECVAPAGSTAPSHATLFTGLYPKRHRVQRNGHVLAQRFTTLAERFQQQGYRTAGFAALLSLMKRGFAQGFQTHGRDAVDVRVRSAAEINEDVLRWLHSLSLTPTTPFFLWVHYFDVHSPYHATQWSESRLVDYGGSFGQEVTSVQLGFGQWMRNPADLQAVRTLYDGQLHDTDASFGRLLAALKETGRLGNTLIVVAADHGQALGEHQHPAHVALWDSILRVPLLIWDGRDSVGRQVSKRVGLVDVAPTVLELAGIAVPDGLDGRSLVPAIHGKELPEAPYFAMRLETPAFAESPKWLPGKKFRFDAAAYLGRLKVMVGGGEPVAFDLRSDPGELSPLAADDLPPGYTALIAGATAHLPTKAIEREHPEMPDDVKRQLRALGYAD